MSIATETTQMTPEQLAAKKKAEDKAKYEMGLVRKWEKFMGPIRERISEEHRTQKPQAQRDFFRYEHPDLEREGIVFNGQCKDR